MPKEKENYDCDTIHRLLPNKLDGLGQTRRALYHHPRLMDGHCNGALTWSPRSFAHRLMALDVNCNSLDGRRHVPYQCSPLGRRMGSKPQQFSIPWIMSELWPANMMSDAWTSLCLQTVVSRLFFRSKDRADEMCLERRIR